MMWSTATAINVAAVAVAISVTYGVTCWKKISKVSKLLRRFVAVETVKVTESEFVVLGHFQGDIRDALLIIRRRNFHGADRKVILESISLERILQNDIYSSYVGSVSSAFKPFKVVGCVIVFELKTEV